MFSETYAERTGKLMELPLRVFISSFGAGSPLVLVVVLILVLVVVLEGESSTSIMYI
jgi:hypothetical protein